MNNDCIFDLRITVATSNELASINSREKIYFKSSLNKQYLKSIDFVKKPLHFISNFGFYFIEIIFL